MGAFVPSYVAKFFDHRDQLFGWEPFDAEHDEAAKNYANRMLKSPFGKGHEIWHDDRLVHRELYE